MREYGCISETHTEEEARHREGGGGQGDNLVDLHLFTRGREGKKNTRESLASLHLSEEVVTFQTNGSRAAF